MRPYLGTARRYRWLLIAILAVVWGAGLVAAYIEYKSTYEAQATIWALRASPDLVSTSTDDPSLPVLQTAAAQQAELLTQLLQTRSVLADVVGRTSLRPAYEAARDQNGFLDDLRKHFHVQTLGSNMLSVSVTARSGVAAAEMVDAALAVRSERVAKARLASTSTVGALYQREFEIAQTQALEAQRELEDFNAQHKGTLGIEDDHQQAQLRLALSFAQARLGDLKGRIDRATVAPVLLEMSGMEFQVIDEPRAQDSPSGGTRAAGMLAASALAAGALIAVLLVFIGTLVADHVAGPADVGRLAPAKLFASVPRVSPVKGAGQRDLRESLVVIAFGDPAQRTVDEA